jgi:uncharacterized protein DUF6339
VKLQRLSAEARSLVVRELATGALLRHDPSAYDRFLDDAAVSVDLSELDEKLDGIIATTRRYDASIDRVAAPAIHRTLPLTRREAANPGVWRFLAVAHRPDFVRHRWEARSWAAMQTRFWSPGTRPDSNAFYRLWWIAELTSDGGSYELTERLFARQPVANELFKRGFSRVRSAVEAFVDEMDEAPSDEVERVARELNGALGTLVLEALGVDDLRRLVRAFRAGTGAAVTVPVV